MDDRILQLEKLIGKPIGDASKLGHLITTPNRNYTFIPKLIEEFLDVACGKLQICIDTNKTIESISIPFPVILNRNFYDEMIRIYGYPNNILVNDELSSESKSKDSGEEGFRQDLSKRVYSIKEVSFEENPFLIIWNKEHFQIKMTFYYKYGGTQLIFRKPTDSF